MIAIAVVAFFVWRNINDAEEIPEPAGDAEPTESTSSVGQTGGLAAIERDFSVRFAA